MFSFYNFPPDISSSIEAICNNLSQTLSGSTWVILLLIQLHPQKLWTIWCLRCKFDLWSNTCPYLSIRTVLRRNNPLRSWTARVCDSNRVFLTFFSVFFGEKIAGREVDKKRSFGDLFLLNWAENISIIDLVVEVDFLISLLQHRSRFFMVDEPHSLIPWRYFSESSFETSWIICSFTSNCTLSSMSLNLFYVISPPPFSLSSRFSSTKLYQSKPDSTKSDSSELDSDRKSSC